MLMQRFRKSNRPKLQVLSKRRGVAVTELAICTPILLLISVALIELTSLIFVKQSLSVAAYEGAHQGVQASATASDVIRAANEILTQRRIQGGSVTVTPSDIPNVPAGELFTVRVSASSDVNGLAIFRLFSSAQLNSEAVAMKEFEVQ